jgi:hypothetical protein
MIDCSLDPHSRKKAIVVMREKGEIEELLYNSVTSSFNEECEFHHDDISIFSMS